jgi:hypothetical protein
MIRFAAAERPQLRAFAARWLVVVLVALLGASLVPLAAAQTTAAPGTFSSASETLVYQLQLTSVPMVPFASYYTSAAIAANGGLAFCQPFYGESSDGSTASFEGVRRTIARISSVDPQRIVIFPTDGILARFSVLRSQGQAAPPMTPAPATAAPPTTTTPPGNATSAAAPPLGTTTTTAVPTATVAGRPTTASPSTSAEITVVTVWVAVGSTNSSAAALQQGERATANALLLRFVTNGGDPTVLADAIGPSFFAFRAVDFGAPLSFAPMAEQTRRVERAMRDVYNTEWDRFLVGMIATTILGTAAYVTVHCFIHRVPTRQPLVASTE